MTYEVVEEGLEHAHVLGVRDKPVERREVLALRQLLVQAPEHLRGKGKKGGVRAVGLRVVLCVSSCVSLCALCTCALCVCFVSL